MLRGALVGAGNIALRGHLPAYKGDAELAAAAEIVAIVDPAVTTSDEARELLAGAAAHRDLDSLLQARGAALPLDFVDVCSPPDTHAAVVRACAAAGLHVVCEKPLAHRPEAAAEIGRAVRDAGVVFVPCHQYKDSPLWRAVHGFVTRGELGRIVLAQFGVCRLQADTGTAGWNPAWRTHREHSGGGILTDTGAHYFYLARWMFGMPVRVSALLRTLRHHDYGVEDTAAVTLEHPSGTITRLDLTWAASVRANSMRVVGTEGALHYDGRRLVHATADGEHEIPMPDVSDKRQYVSWYAALLREFVRRVAARDAGTDLLAEAEDVMRLLAASARSSERGVVVDLD
jgi:predicted dehydrogenase